MAEPNIDDLAIFVRVVDRSGFASAARELGVPTSTVSRTITRLEDKLGVRLVHRTTRTVKPTTDGRELYANVAPAVSTLRAAARSIEPATREPRGRLRVAAPADAMFLAPLIIAFSERYPAVQIELALSSRHVDLVDEGFDIAVRATPKLEDSSLVVRKVGPLDHSLYASPAYLIAHGSPRAPSDLHQHRCVLFRAKDLARTWSLRRGTSVEDVHVRGHVSGDDFTFVRSLILAGGGIGLLPQINCQPEEARGALVRVLPELSVRGATLFVMMPSKDKVPSRVTAFREAIVEAYEEFAQRERRSTRARR